MTYSVAPCKDAELVSRGLKYEVLAKSPTSPSTTCVALCYEDERAGKIANALNAVASKN